MKRKTVRIIALATAIIVFVTSVGLIAMSVFFGR